jgi:hypothetical protein
VVKNERLVCFGARRHPEVIRRISLGCSRVEMLMRVKTHELEFHSVTMLGDQLPTDRTALTRRSRCSLIVSAAVLLNRYARHKAILLVDRPIGCLGVFVDHRLTAADECQPAE